MKMIRRALLLAFGLSSFSLAFAIMPFVEPSHEAYYHLGVNASTILLAASASFLPIWLLAVVLFLLAERYSRLWGPIWATILFSAPWILLKNCAWTWAWPVPHWLSMAVLASPAAIFGIVSYFRPGAAGAIFRKLQRFAAVLLGFLALSGAVLLAEFAWSLWQARNLNPPFRSAGRVASQASTPRHPRIVWILLDELSYRQVYERRFPGLKLPAFDQLAAQSTVFSHVIPTAIRTEIAVPSLFTGLPADAIRVSADGRLQTLRHPGSGAWQSFDPKRTVFQDAVADGYSPSISGWFNPYCRIFSDLLDQCFWVNRLSYPQPGQSWQTTISIPLRYLRSIFATGLRLGNVDERVEREEAPGHIRDYKEIKAAGDRMLADPAQDFLFLHIPVPHPFGIYDRRKMAFAESGGSYLDNLALADQYLGEVRQFLEERGQWDSSVIVVMGDHSWRTQLLWAGRPTWTPEEQQASDGGQFDDRPAYLVKMPMQDKPARVDTPFQAVKTRALLDAIMSGRLRTAQDLEAWASAQSGQ
jgi:hypothetical protein